MSSDAWVDLAEARLGGLVLDANDEYFAPKENLLRQEPPTFAPDTYGDRGKIMDGWETRRRRDGGHDWCVVRLGVPGVIREAVVDTRNFRGNHPEACALEGCAVEGDAVDDAREWVPLVPKAPLAGDAVNRFKPSVGWRVTHVRLRIYPDGGVARLRLLGDPLVDLREELGTMDLASVLQGGRAVASSDAFFSSPHNLVAPGGATHMGDGWETRRSREAREDWAVVALAAPCHPEVVEVDTSHFKGNYPDRCAIDACGTGELLPGDDAGWRELVPSTPMRPHARHRLRVIDPDPVTHVRLRIQPDGGVARLRVLGRVTDEGRRMVGLRWLNALLPADAEDVLARCCAARPWVRAMADGRPYDDVEALMQAADEHWARLEPDSWLVAFEAHPRIGERTGGAWSRQEQAGTAEAHADTLAALAEANRAYEARFGHVFLICASGKGPEEMLENMRQRMDNDPAAELVVAAEEHRKITRLRLEKLLCP